MNLIDKNKTLMSLACHCAFCKERTGFYPQMCRTCEFDCVEDIVDNQPTVEAIPVDWLLKHLPLDEVMNEYNRRLVEYLVIGWRKENEQK